ncbi:MULTISPECIES: DJ-1/PfpI family protein [unclassified Achromobacter]|uniref:DJ-1/PfpI family protein n=1 Tax=unclassified Achromobacter TaxID=2626865 RepID=UPI000B51C865|nr:MULTISPECIES: DJ-1/PfpI family protein [unclassified Achromobacter]OWT74830.1 thiamine biosynthesis protein ThiJ [Achromobacter sp. HZ34]OWT79744.1 thiamine biosynthesis protein ThiJ [Achromobacter sp. HZ28]
MKTEPKTRIGMLVFPMMTSLDILGPFEVLARAPDCHAELVWKDRQPIKGDTGLVVTPDRGFSDAPQYDVIVVPGGPGQTPLMEDTEVIQFLRQQAAGAQLVTSVCTGSLLLAAAGLLAGRKATSHWLSIDQLGLFGVEIVPERVVVDGDRITGAGVTSGLDFAFRVLAELRGAEAAKALQLMLEYDPAPPFESGHPRVAEPALVEQVRLKAREMIGQRREVSQRVAGKLAG